MFTEIEVINIHRWQHLSIFPWSVATAASTIPPNAYNSRIILGLEFGARVGFEPPTFGLLD